MDIVSLLGISVGLAMDAFAVSISNGATYRRATLRDALKTGAFFGIFQAVMPIIGWLAGTAFTRFITDVDHWIALILLGYLGGRMVYEAVKKKREDSAAPKEDGSGKLQGFLTFRALFTLAVATSIDALAVGVSLAMVKADIALAAPVIGMTTFAISFFGAAAGKKLGTKFEKKAMVAGGAVLVAIGIKILLEHLLA